MIALICLIHGKHGNRVLKCVENLHYGNEPSAPPDLLDVEKGNVRRVKAKSEMKLPNLPRELCVLSAIRALTEG